MNHNTKTTIKFLAIIIGFILAFLGMSYVRADDMTLYQVVHGKTNAGVICQGLATNINTADMIERKQNDQFTTTSIMANAAIARRPPVITAKQIYWVTRLDPIKDLCAVYVFLSILIIGGFILLWVYGYEEDKRVPRILGATLTFVASLLFLCAVAGTVLVPTTKEMAMIQITPIIANSDFVQEDLPREAKELYSLAKQYFSDAVKKQ